MSTTMSTLRDYGSSVVSQGADAFNAALKFASETAEHPSTWAPLATAAAAGFATRCALNKLATASTSAASTTTKDVRHVDEEALKGLEALALFTRPAQSGGLLSSSSVSYTKEEAAALSTLKKNLSTTPGTDQGFLQRVFGPLETELQKSGNKDATTFNLAPIAEDDLVTLATIFTGLYKDYLPANCNVGASLKQDQALGLIKGHIESKVSERQQSEISRWTTMRTRLEPLASSAAAKLTAGASYTAGKLSTGASYARSAASSAWATSVDKACSLATRSVPYLPSRNTTISLAAAAVTGVLTSYAMRDEDSQ